MPKPQKEKSPTSSANTAALRGNVITAKHRSRAFEGALISILAEVRQLGVLRFLLAGFRQHKGGEDCSMVGWISGDGDICVCVRFIESDGHRVAGLNAGSPVIDKIDSVMNFGGTDFRRRSAGRPCVAGSYDLVGPNLAERVDEADGAHLFRGGILDL